uniref:Tr-type G domain-containing protein n=1 Tax=Syphacia muris TaxID=451379 RepID=A0A0N5AK53_9BILA
MQYSDYIDHIRNIGIIAHIDAGKTTVSERMLYLAGAIRTVGNVDCGTTVTDYLDLERERGITIQSASVFFNWLNCKINLIDTPGHVDFSSEVERCSRVLDGVVAILDAAAGVQAQTITVWQQAKKNFLPGTLFANKMDKPNANFEKTIESIENRLSLKNVIPIAIPVFTSDGKFCGICDLIERKYLNCSSDKEAKWISVHEGRENMLSKLADADEDFGEWLLMQTKTDAESFDDKINECLRNNTLSRNINTVTCGTAFRCAESVRPVLNIVAKYFPSPIKKSDPVKKIYGNNFSALVFKVNHDKRHGQLNYIRIYTGQLKNGSNLYNANQHKIENHVSTFLPYSDILKPVGSVEAGDIAVITGLKSTVTGDTLLELKHCSNDLLKKQTALNNNKNTEPELDKSFLLAGINSPDPVFFCSIEPPDSSSQKLFDKALHELTVEDPSLRIRTEDDQTIIETMGELHLEVVKDKLLRDYGLKVFIGPIEVAYREVADGNIVHSATVSSIVGERKLKHECYVLLELSSKPKCGVFEKVKVNLVEQEDYVLRPDWLKAINDGCKNALLSGPILGCPVLDVEITLKLFKVSGNKILSSVISAATCKCVREALLNIPVYLIEPVVDVEVEFNDVNGEGVATNRVLQEISKRRGTIRNVYDEIDKNDTKNNYKKGLFRIFARIPVGETLGLSTAVRTLTSGLGNLHMHLAGYDVVPDEIKCLLAEKKRIN